jgi:hypothetical protein
MKARLLCIAMLIAFPMASSFAEECNDLPSATQLQQYLMTAPSTGGEAGGLFHGTLRMISFTRSTGCPCSCTPTA